MLPGSGAVPIIVSPDKSVAAAAWKVIPMGFTTATMIAEQRQDMIQVCTGCKELDSILEGTAQPLLSQAGARLEQPKGGWMLSRGYRDWLHHRDLWREQVWQDAAVPHPLRHLSGAHSKACAVCKQTGRVAGRPSIH